MIGFYLYSVFGLKGKNVMLRYCGFLCALLLGCGSSVSTGEGGSGGSGGEGGSGGGYTATESASGGSGGGTAGSGGEGGSGGYTCGGVTVLQGCVETSPADDACCQVSYDDMAAQCQEATLGAYPFPHLCKDSKIDKCVWIGVKDVACSWVTGAYLYCCPCD